MANRWRGSLKGWRWLAAWAILVVVITPIVRIILALSAEKPSQEVVESPWVVSAAIAFGGVIVIALAIRCFCSRRNFWRFALGAACLAVLIAAFYAEENIRGYLMWKSFKREWEAKGEKLDFAKVVPPPVPPDQNFALAPVVAGSYNSMLDPNGHRKEPFDSNIVNRLQMPLDCSNDGPTTNGIGNWMKGTGSHLELWQQYYRDLSTTTNLFAVPPDPRAPGADVLLALGKYDSTVEELRQAAALPASRFPLNYDEGNCLEILLPHLSSLKSCIKLLQLRSLAELEMGNGEAALADINLGLALVNKIRDEPFLISHLVRLAMLQLIIQPIWEGLAHHQWTDAQLAELDRQLAGFNFAADYQCAMRGEAAGHATAMEYFNRHRKEMTLEDADATPSVYLVPSGWFYQNELFAARFVLERRLPAADPSQQVFYPARAAAAGAFLSGVRPSPYTLVGLMLLPAAENSARKFAIVQATVNLARTACALERCRLARGKYPESLDALCPQFLAKVPIDSMGGQPLHYQLTNDTFILYSIGWDEKDDGGTTAFTRNGAVDLQKGDLVWHNSVAPESQLGPQSPTARP